MSSYLSRRRAPPPAVGYRPRYRFETAGRARRRRRAEKGALLAAALLAAAAAAALVVFALRILKGVPQ